MDKEYFNQGVQCVSQQKVEIYQRPRIRWIAEPVKTSLEQDTILDDILFQKNKKINKCSN